ncbi:hypothetical protein F5148DRAFT_1290027 [Russula earlei]|uniref:Uncharacterized protein n=1 Tax=Russula earlei TaxID=71964 RepID=A0ACC0TX91_9AGAM|nr:hypothetical protein F5148DRAFT_1290027 [Russula earlei]
MSMDSSDEDDNGGGLPASGLVAPWEVLCGLADVTIQRAAKASQCKHPFGLYHSYAAIVKTSTIQKTEGPSDAMVPHVLKFSDGMQNLL